MSEKNPINNIHAAETEEVVDTQPSTQPRPSFYDEQWKPGDELLSKYKVDRILGKGGMGVVYLVRQINGDYEYAVKTLRTSRNSVKLRRRLMREIRTWMDLPDHPNLARCYFFRTIDDNMTVFSEFIDGGTLFDWARTPEPQSLEKILDVLIQLAWGLHAAHVNSVIHQDVKSSNVLLTREGIVKLTDFGLSSIGATEEMESPNPDAVRRTLVTSHGMTPAYCSPEQANKRKLCSKTDMWSYGITAIEMFTREVTWLSGTAGPGILRELSNPEHDGTGPIIPETIQPILDRCFKKEPADRWNDMLEIAGELVQVYKAEIGKDYHRQIPDFPELPIRDELDRQSIVGNKWKDPLIWLKKAMDHQGIEDSKDVHQFIPERKGSRRVQAIVDLEVYHMAERIYQSMIRSGRIELEWELMDLYYQKSFVNEYLDDNDAAWVLMDRMIQFADRHLSREFTERTTLRFASICLRAGTHLHYLGKYKEAQDIFLRAVEVTQAVDDKGLDWIPGRVQSMIYENLSVVAMDMTENEKGIVYSEKAIDILEQMLAVDYTEDIHYQLGSAYTNLAGALAFLKRFDDASEKMNKGLDILIDLADQKGHSKARMHLMFNLLNKSMLMCNLNNLSQAIEASDQALELVQTMIQQEDRMEMRTWEGAVNVRKGTVYRHFTDYSKALVFIDQGIKVLKNLIQVEGLFEPLKELFYAYGEKAEILESMGDLIGSIEFLNQAIHEFDQYEAQYQGQELLKSKKDFQAKRDEVQGRLNG